MRSRFWIKIVHPKLLLAKLRGGSTIQAAATLAFGHHGRMSVFDTIMTLALDCVVELQLGEPAPPTTAVADPICVMHPSTSAHCPI